MLQLYGTQITSRLLLGTARYPSPAILAEAARRSGTEIVTVSLRRETAGGRTGSAFFDFVRGFGVRVLPNTAGCHSISEAVLTAKMARDLFGTNWDQARTDRPPRHSSAGPVPTGRGGTHPLRRRL